MNSIEKFGRKCIVLLACAGAFFLEPLSSESVEDTFTNIYNGGWWGRDEEGNGVSGSGSLLVNAKPYINFLEEFMKRHSIRSVVDAGCGDWAFSQHVRWDGVRYIGIDAVSEVISRNIRRFSSSNITFIQADILTYSLPSADLLLCKDVLQHLTHDEIQRFIGQLGKFKHALITNDVNPMIESQENIDIVRGQYRRLDVTQPPFQVQGIKIFRYWSDGDLKEVLYVSQGVVPDSF